MKYFATVDIGNRRVDFEAETLRAAKVKAGKEIIYDSEVVKLFEEDEMGGLLKSVKKEGGRWEDSFI